MTYLKVSTAEQKVCLFASLFVQFFNGLIDLVQGSMSAAFNGDPHFVPFKAIIDPVILSV